MVTILGGALTILILPAFTRQWEDRQRALDLKTALVEEISTATGRSITSAEILFETFEGKPADFAYFASTITPSQGLRRRWLSARLKIEGKLRVYFSPELFDQWSAYDTAMVNFLAVAGWEGRMNKIRRSAESKGRLVPVKAFEEMVVFRYLDGIPVLYRESRQRIRSFLVADSPTLRRSGFLSLERALLDIEADFTSRLLAADPNGFSTTRQDLINDLLP